MPKALRWRATSASVAMIASCLRWICAWPSSISCVSASNLSSFSSIDMADTSIYLGIDAHDFARVVGQDAVALGCTDVIDQFVDFVDKLSQQVHRRHARAVLGVEGFGARWIGPERIDVTPRRWRCPAVRSPQMRCR